MEWGGFEYKNGNKEIGPVEGDEDNYELIATHTLGENCQCQPIIYQHNETKKIVIMHRDEDPSSNMHRYRSRNCHGS